VNIPFLDQAQVSWEKYQLLMVFWCTWWPLMGIFDDVSLSTVPIDLDKVPAPTLPLMGLMDQNLYINKYSFTLLALNQKMEVPCIPETSALLTTFTWLN
jgi:hypothetical protein